MEIKENKNNNKNINTKRKGGKKEILKDKGLKEHLNLHVLP